MIVPRTKHLRIAYQRVFESPEGKLVLEDLRRHAPLLTAPVGVSKGVDVHMLLVLEGRSDVLKHIYDMLHRDPNEDRPERAINSRTGE